MQSRTAATATEGSRTAHPEGRPDLRVVRANGSAGLFRAFGLLTAALVSIGGYVHFCLYRHGYRTIPKIGFAFLLQVVMSAVVVVALLMGPHRVARIAHGAHLTDRLAATVTGMASAVLAAGTLLAFALSRTPGGLFNFQERGLEPAPQALIALVAEIGVLVVLGAWLVADHVARRGVRTLAAARV